MQSGRLLLTQEVTVHIKGQPKPAPVAESLAMFSIGPAAGDDKSDSGEGSAT